jgi:hypothetical protein
MGRTCSMHAEMKNSHDIFVGKPEEKRQLGKINHRW